MNQSSKRRRRGKGAVAQLLSNASQFPRKALPGVGTRYRGRTPTEASEYTLRIVGESPLFGGHKCIDINFDRWPRANTMLIWYRRAYPPHLGLSRCRSMLTVTHFIAQTTQEILSKFQISSAIRYWLIWRFCCKFALIAVMVAPYMLFTVLESIRQINALTIHQRTV